MILNTSFRPTPYRDLHVGGAWNAYLNWCLARRTGGEFVLVVDDLWMELAACAFGGFPADVAAERYVEDLEWLGCKPDRVEFSLSNRERHRWAAEKLGYREPVIIGPTPGHAEVHRSMYDPTNFGDHLAPGPGGEGQLQRFDFSFCGYYMAACVVDDIDFRIGAWIAGDDQRGYQAWCLDAYRRLGYNPPYMMYHPVVKRTASLEKISKTPRDPEVEVPGTGIRALRASGYTAQQIMGTLKECSARSWAKGEECVILPHGVLEPGKLKVLRYRNRQLEHYRRGNLDAAIPPEARSYIVAEAKRRLQEGHDAIRVP